MAKRLDDGVFPSDNDDLGRERQRLQGPGDFHSHGLSRLSIVGRRAGFAGRFGASNDLGAPTPGPAGVTGRPQAEREPERSGGSQRALDAGGEAPVYLPGAPRCPYTARSGSRFACPSPTACPPAASGRAPCCSTRIPWNGQAGLRGTGPVTTCTALQGRPSSALAVKCRHGARLQLGGCSYPGTAVLGQSRSRTRAHTAHRSPSSGSTALSVQPAAGTQWTQTMSAVR